MNDLVSQKLLTMSSRSIAELTGKRHSDVLRDIRVMLSGLEMDESKFASTYTDESNRQKPCYELEAELINTLITGYHVKLRHAVSIRLKELEDGPKFNVPKTMAQALRLAADQQEQIESLATKIKQDTPKVEYVNNYMNGEGLRGLQEAAKSLGYKPRLFIERLTGQWLYRSNDRLLPYQKYLDMGIFKVIEGENRGVAYNQTKITPKGMVYFGTRLSSELGQG
jgi:phage antirepressor YoqD-like protein